MLKKENIYVSLEGKSKEDLTGLYWLLKNNNEKLFHNDLSVFIEEYYKTNRFLEYYSQRWGGGDNLKTEVTIQQLKEILQPMEGLQEQLEKAEAEVKRLKKEINKIKVGDWVYCKTNDCIFKYQFGRLEDDLKKITDQELINKLNELIK